MLTGPATKTTSGKARACEAELREERRADNLERRDSRLEGDGVSVLKP